MSRAERCALGLSVHTGWAAAVVATGSVRAPKILLREEIELLGDADRFLYHRAAELSLAEAERLIAAARRAVAVSSREALEELLEAAGAAGGKVVGGVVVAKRTKLDLPLERILAAHPKLHTAEGCFYRGALVEALAACRIAGSVMTPDEALASAPKPAVDAAGKKVGRPWAMDQKLAALAAWSVLA